MEDVSVRELRQNLSVYLRRIEADGASLRVLSRGRPVATLGPAPTEPVDEWQRLVDAGVIRPATRPWSSVPPPLPPRPGPSLSELLDEVRGPQPDAAD